VRPHVGEIADAHVEPTRHATKHLAYGAVVLPQGPGASSAVARENQVHRASRADGTLELALAATNLAPVLGSRELDLRRTIEKGQLHRRTNLITVRLGAMSFPLKPK
jgi:hypothetical protein